MAIQHASSSSQPHAPSPTLNSIVNMPRWDGSIKHLLITCLLNNISAKEVKIASHTLCVTIEVLAKFSDVLQTLCRAVCMQSCLHTALKPMTDDPSSPPKKLVRETRTRNSHEKLGPIYAHKTHKNLTRETWRLMIQTKTLWQSF